MTCHIPRLLLAAPASGSGKTTLTCALLRVLERRGLSPCAFKCGPDYIDPMFHRSVLGLPSRNLDLFFSTPDEVRRNLTRGARGRGTAVIEGVMGYYDGVGGGERASSWHLAQVTQTPTILVAEPKGSALTLAAVLQGLARFRKPSQVWGVLLNGTTPAMAARLSRDIRRETGLPVLGCLPRMPECAIPSRHLGLYTPGEIADLGARVDKLADALEQYADVDGLLAIARSAPDLEVPEEPEETVASAGVLAVAWDEAFCFYYQENLELLERCGLKLVKFSPLTDQKLPEGTCGVYLGGGYPELYAKQLSGNAPMLAALREAAAVDLPILAECGGFLYLQQSLEDPEGTPWPMAGVLEGFGFQTGRLQRFGYVTLAPKENSAYLRTGETLAAHEFHRWDCTQNGESCLAQKPESEKSWNCMLCNGNLLAGFPHLYLPSCPQVARRFADACRRWKERL
ncbi:cobyrinate a,c-diamide synthase [Pseudoflavonifractor phocaeensis]|uniref:cobyrinate a,c-diamide synthase n=1 Tax=Pseudoflavonifractor phocaeensis TaxID=1870988 RepID=UPI0025A40288|nr:cobyrinate a,c-diamide synthase [Pseudoflavonifractor phocaeensis]MDM8238819.1 cobyrinate a,c-diamide synthase [Pseudoflavonifractor phocaeensis]